MKDRGDTCWNCGGQLIWSHDCRYDDIYHEGEGVISFLNCRDCGAEVQYTIKSVDLKEELRGGNM